LPPNVQKLLDKRRLEAQLKLLGDVNEAHDTPQVKKEEGVWGAVAGIVLDQ
jgi:hypothetical protein